MERGMEEREHRAAKGKKNLFQANNELGSVSKSSRDLLEKLGFNLLYSKATYNALCLFLLFLYMIRLLSKLKS